MTQEGQPVTLNGTFADPRTNEMDVVTIDWGDGSADTTLVLAAGVRTFAADHTYTAQGDFFPTVFVANADGQTAAAAPSVQVLPAPFSAVLIVQGQPGQSVSGSVTDPVTGDVIEVSFTVAPTNTGTGVFLAAQLTNGAPPPSLGVVEVISTYDFREHNLSQQDSVQVILIIRESLESGTVPVVLYLDPSSGQERVFQGDVHFSQGPNVLIVTIVFDNSDTPRLIDLTNTVFTVVAAVPGATATAAVSASVASAAPNAIVPVQTATFQSSSSLKLTLATTQLGQVSQSLSSLDDGGGGESGEPSGGADDALAKLLVKELEALWRFEAEPVLSSWGLTPQDKAPPPKSAPQAPEGSQPQQSREEAPAQPHAGEVLAPSPAADVDPPAPALDPANARKASRAATSAAYVLAAPLIGPLPGKSRRRRKKGRNEPTQGENEE